MKIAILGTAALLCLTACDEESALSRGSAIAQIQNTIPGIPYDQADGLIDDICAEFAQGWGASYITETKYAIPQELREDFAHVIWLAARTECPGNVRDAEHWQERNGWEN